MGREWKEGSGRNRREEEDLSWEENGKKGVEGNSREEEDLLWEENGKKGGKGIEGKKRIFCGKRMGRGEWMEIKG